MASPGQSPRRKRLPRFAAALRTCHLYLSMTASLAIAFFALSGMVANLRDDTDAGNLDLVPEAVLATTDSIATYIQQRFDLSTPPIIESIGDDLYVGNAEHGEEHLEFTLYRRTRAFDYTTWLPLPPGQALDREALTHWISETFSGVVESSDDPDDDLDLPIQFRINSVWHSRTLTVERSDRRWGQNLTTHSWGQALTALHTGRYASPAQRWLTTIVAGALLLSVASGFFLGVLWLAQLRRRIPVLTAILGGVLCLIALLAGR